jgi:hypothetical protein
MLTIQEIYTAARELPPADRLRLAARLIEDIASQTPSDSEAFLPTDYSEEWSDEDKHDVTRHALQYATSLYGDERDLEDAHV